MRAPESLIAELESTVSGRSNDKRQQTLQRVTDLFLTHAERFNEDHVDVFDDVLLHLVKLVETEATMELGQRLAPVDNAPFQVIQHLARHDDIAVAAPVLAKSTQLADHDLSEIAATKSDEHMAAIAKRANLDATVTDVIVDRADRDTIHQLVNNVGASFSHKGFEKLLEHATDDPHLGEQVGLRLDLPPPVLQQLLDKVSTEVQSRLMAFAPIETRAEIHRIVSAISSDIARGAAAALNLAGAQEFVRLLQEKDEFGESTLLEFAKMGKFEELIVGLSELCAAPTTLMTRLMQSPRHEGLLIVCKASGLQWLTVGAILSSRSADHAMAVEELRKAKAEYTKLSQPAAQKIMRFMLVRATVPAVPAQARSRQAKPADKPDAKSPAKPDGKAKSGRHTGRPALNHAAGRT